MNALLPDDDEQRITLHLLNIYLTHQAEIASQNYSLFCGVRRSVLHKQALSTDKHLCSHQLLDSFWNIMHFVEAHHTFTSPSLMNELVTADATNRLCSDDQHFIFEHLLFDDLLSLDPYIRIWRMFEGFVFLGKLATLHFDNRRRLDNLANDCIHISERILTRVIKPYGGWNTTIEISKIRQFPTPYLHPSNTAPNTYYPTNNLLWSMINSFFRDV
jgi:hypothetical protein